MQSFLERLKDYELYINIKKYKFNINEIKFLSFIILIKEVQMNSKQI